MTGSFVFPRVQAIPQIGRVALCVDGVERVGYEFGEGTSRPFLFPLIGPSGSMLTRLGHPNPIGHEHHKSVWFGHQSVGGINFWEEQPGTDVRIRHRRVRLFHDGHDWGGLTAELDWWGGGRSVLSQQLTIAVAPRRAAAIRSTLNRGSSLLAESRSRWVKRTSASWESGLPRRCRSNSAEVS